MLSTDRTEAKRTKITLVERRHKRSIMVTFSCMELLVLLLLLLLLQNIGHWQRFAL